MVWNMSAVNQFTFTMRISAPYTEQVSSASDLPNGAATWNRIFRNILCYKTRIRHEVINYGTKPVRIGLREQDNAGIQNDNFIDTQPRWKFFTVGSKNVNTTGSQLTGGVIKKFTSTHNISKIAKKKIFQEDNWSIYLADPITFPIPPPVDTAYLQVRARSSFSASEIMNVHWHMWIDYKVKYRDFIYVNDRPLGEADDEAGFDEGVHQANIDADDPANNTAAPSG